MRKSILVLGFLCTTLLNAQPLNNVDKSIKVEVDELPTIVKKEVKFRTDILKAQWIKIQIKSNKVGLEKSIQLLNELKPIVEKMEKQVRK